MKDFSKEVEARGLTALLGRAVYKTPFYYGWAKVCQILREIVDHNAKTLIYGDYDIDGLKSALIVRDGLHFLGCDNLTVYEYENRTHSLDSGAVQQAIQEHFEYVIVCDTGSQNFGALKRMTQYGIKVVMLDHHVLNMSYDEYPSDIAVINTTTENHMGGNFALSAAALCFTVMDLLYQEYGRPTPCFLAPYAVISLYSDCMSMQNELNRAIYHLGVAVPRNELPRYVKYFLNDYMSFNARFIGYWYSPRINSLFRSENFEPINQLFFRDESNAVELAKILAEINKIYQTTRELVSTVSDTIVVNELENFIIASINSVDEYISVEANKLYNYTGLVANQLTSKYKKTALVLCKRDDNYKGSIRDLYSRDYLTLFKQFCDAGGHPSAFGLHVSYFDIDNFLQMVMLIDSKYSIGSIGNSPIVIEVPDTLPDPTLIQDMAYYNEFSGINVPIALIQKRYIGNIVEVKNPYSYKYEWGEFYIQSDYKLRFGQKFLMKPYFSGKTKLLVQ